tara:strand:+ start:24426 stop:25061 length:636 start_codon:yes stop_codon:yes gene_type:complete
LFDVVVDSTITVIVFVVAQLCYGGRRFCVADDTKSVGATHEGSFCATGIESGKTVETKLRKAFIDFAVAIVIFAIAGFLLGGECLPCTGRPDALLTGARACLTRCFTDVAPIGALKAARGSCIARLCTHALVCFSVTIVIFSVADFSCRGALLDTAQCPCLAECASAGADSFLSFHLAGFLALWVVFIDFAIAIIIFSVAGLWCGGVVLLA